jgi:hypothetical protein
VPPMSDRVTARVAMICANSQLAEREEFEMKCVLVNTICFAARVKKEEVEHPAAEPTRGMLWCESSSPPPRGPGAPAALEPGHPTWLSTYIPRGVSNPSPAPSRRIASTYAGSSTCSSAPNRRDSASSSGGGSSPYPRPKPRTGWLTSFLMSWRLQFTFHNIPNSERSRLRCRHTVSEACRTRAAARRFQSAVVNP